MYKHILIPTDGSPASRAAALRGVALAKSVGARVTAFYAAPAPTPVVYKALLPVGIVKPKEHAAMIERAAQRYLEVIAKAAKAAKVPCNCVHVTDDFPAEAILAAAKKHGCDLIHIAPQSRTGIARVLLGSQTQKVLAQAKVPVLVYR